MIGYWDTSAFVPLLVDEPGTAACLEFWQDADDIVTARLTYVETAAALGQAARAGRIAERSHRRSLAKLEELWAEFDVIEIDQALVQRAAQLADQFALRGHDAVHCAAAEQVAADDLVAATGDRQLLVAWAKLAISTFDPNRPD